MFLTPEDLQILTGYTRHTKQAEWLTRNGIPFRINAKGMPVVAKAAAEPATANAMRLGVVR